MVVHLLVQKRLQNNSIKGKLEEARKIATKCKKKDAFDVKVEGSLDDAIKGTPLNLVFGSLRVLYILYSVEQTELLTFPNQVL